MVRERAVTAIMRRIAIGAVASDGWPLMLGGRATCTAEELAEAHRRLAAQDQECAPGDRVT